MKIYIFLLMIFLTGLSHGQVSIKKSGISTGGGSGTAGNTSITYAIGEVAIQEANNGSIAISEGFISPDILGTLGIQDYTILQGANVYPNPAIKDVQISLPDTETYKISITDLTGKEIFTQTTENVDQVKIEIGNLSRDMYLLVVKDLNHKRYALFKLIKK
jgi:hypothetical protein